MYLFVLRCVNGEKNFFLREPFKYKWSKSIDVYALILPYSSVDTIVDLLSENSDAVIRFQGGHNAGHT